MVRKNECSSYPRYKLTSDFYKEVLGFKGLQETLRDNKSSSYPMFELPRDNCSSLYIYLYIVNVSKYLFLLSDNEESYLYYQSVKVPRFFIRTSRLFFELTCMLLQNNCINNGVTNDLKLVSAIFYQIFIFHKMIHLFFINNPFLTLAPKII